MKKILLLSLFTVALGFVSAQKIYKTSHESRFLTPVISFPQASLGGANLRTLTRFNLAASHRYHYGWGTFGIFGGAVVNNWGVITKNDSSTIKRRVFCMGPELGIRLGFPKGAISLGSEIDFPYQYKEKKFISGTKVKSAKWFNSDVVSAYLPSVFVGIAYKYIDVKLQYLFGNFYNDKKIQTGLNYGKANIYAVSLGFNQLYIKNMVKNFSPKRKSHPTEKRKEEEKEPETDPNIIKTSL